MLPFWFQLTQIRNSMYLNGVGMALITVAMLVLLLMVLCCNPNDYNRTRGGSNKSERGGNWHDHSAVHHHPHRGGRWSNDDAFSDLGPELHRNRQEMIATRPFGKWGTRWQHSANLQLWCLELTNIFTDLLNVTFLFSSWCFGNEGSPEGNFSIATLDKLIRRSSQISRRRMPLIDSEKRLEKAIKRGPRGLSQMVGLAQKQELDDYQKLYCWRCGTTCPFQSNSTLLFMVSFTTLVNNFHRWYFHYGEIIRQRIFWNS